MPGRPPWSDGVAGVDEQAEVDDRDRVALGQRRSSARSRAWPSGRPGTRPRAAAPAAGMALRSTSAVAGRERRVGLDLEDVDAVGEPVVGALLDRVRPWPLRCARGSSCRRRASRRRPWLGASMSDLPPKPPIRSTPRMKRAAGLGLDPLELGRGRAVLEELGQLLVDGLLDLGQLDAGLGVGLDGEAARRSRGRRRRQLTDAGDLVVVDQALVEPRGLAVGQDGAREVERVGVTRCPSRACSRPCRGGPGRRGPGRTLAVRAGPSWRPRPSCRAIGGDGGMSPKYFSTFSRTVLASMSPATTRTALFGP